MIELMDSEPSQNEQSIDGQSADGQSTYDVFGSGSIETLEVAEQKPQGTGASEAEQAQKPNHSFRLTKRQVTIAITILLLLIVIAGGLLLLKKTAKKAPTTVVVNTQSLDNGTLNKLESQTGGPVEQQLTISPNTVFKSGSVVQGSSDITNNLTVGGTANIQGATNIKDNLSVGKSLSVGSNLTVSGLITAASLSVGSITISSINVSGDLVYAGHLIPTGNQPTAKTSTAAANGSVTISGNDTAGTITITTGSGSLTAGEMAVITFRSPFSSTVKVQLTPASAAASNLNYFVTHTGSFFTVNTSSAPAANASYSFDYLVTQ